MTAHGLFVDCRTHWKGRIGQAAASFARQRGGALTLGTDGPDRHGSTGLARHLLQFALRLQLRCTAEAGSDDHGQNVLIRQENDPDPKLTFLEEGPVRLGMRAVFDLIDDAGHYHGDARQDVWLFPEGDVHVSWAIETLDGLAHDRIDDCYVQVLGEDRFTTASVPGSDDRSWARGDAIAWLPFGDTLPQRAVMLRGDDTVAALYWLREQGASFPVRSDHGKVPPFYASRWPTGIQQWTRDDKMGWLGEHTTNASVGVDMAGDAPALRFCWQRDAGRTGQINHSGTLCISLTADERDARRRIAAAQRPLEPTIVGGSLRCFAEEDGMYEIGQGDPTRTVITFPADELERTVRVRHYRRKTDLRHRGGVRATVDGKPVVPQLMSEGELTDDICVVMEMSHRNDSVDDVIVSAQLKRDRPTEIVIEKTAGIQAVYESEIAGIDLQRRAGNRRDVAIWSSRHPDAPVCELDLFSGALHRVTAYGQSEPVIWEAPAMWFRSCGHSRQQFCNYVEDFSIERNGPDDVKLYLRGTNANRRAQSELWLRVPYDHPRTRLEVKMRMTVLEQWDYGNVEFTDIFPYPSRLPETWLHQAVLFVQRDRTSLVYTQRPDCSFHNMRHSDDDRMFYALFAHDRGNVLTYIRNLSADRGRLHEAVCGNYIDIHGHLLVDAPVPAGSVFDIEYVTEIYVNGSTTVDTLKEIAQRSLAADDLVIDAEPAADAANGIDQPTPSVLTA